MENSEEILKHAAASDSRIDLNKRNIRSKRLSVTQNDEEDEELRIVGLKVHFDSDDEYSVATEKRKCKSDDYLRIGADSKGTFDKKIAQARCDFKGAEKESNKDASTVSCKTLSYSINIESDEEKPRTPPILKLRLSPVSKDTKDLEIYIKSSSERRNFVSEDEGSYSENDYYDYYTDDTDVESIGTDEESTCRNGLHCTNSLDEIQTTQDSFLPRITEVTSAETQTEPEFQSSSSQTPSVEIINTRDTQEANIQTEGKCDVSTLTDVKKTKSVTTETDGTPKRHVSVQTEIEIATGSSQTETAAIYSIDRTYDASTQTQELVDTALTDFDIYIVDRQNVCDKAADTEDLPYVPLMVAREERTNSEKKLTNEEKCECQRQVVAHCCCHSQEPGRAMSPHAMPLINQQPEINQQPTIFNCENLPRNICHHFLEEKYDGIITDKEKGETNQQRNCNSKISHEENGMIENQGSIEEFKTPIGLNLTEMHFSSIEWRKNAKIPSKLEIVKHLDNELKNKPIIARQVLSVPKIEKAGIFQIPVIFYHFLESFSLSVFGSSRVVINPVDIAQSVSKSAVSELAASEDFRPSKNLELDRGQKKKTIQYQILYDGKNTKTVRVGSIPPIMPYEEKNSEVSLCNGCFENVRSAVRETHETFYEQGKSSGAGRAEDTLKKTAAKRLPTRFRSPKIKHKQFDYTSRDPWKPFEDTSADVLSEKIEPTEIIDIGMAPSEESLESTDRTNLSSACETVNDHLLCLRPVDEELLKRSAETLHKTWFEAAATSRSDVHEVRNYLRFFEEFSFNLLKTLLHSVDNNGNNVLHFAYANGRFDLAEELLCNGYAVDLLNKTNKSGNSPLMICSISQPTNDNDWAIIRKSFEMGDVDVKSLKSGQTPLMNAASCGFHNMVELLLDVGANPNLQDKDGSTALMYAAEHGHEKCIKVLMKNKKCDPSIRDTDGQTACAVALNNGHKNIAVFIHMQELEKRRLSKNSYGTKRYVWTNNASRKRFSPEVQRF